MTKEAVARMAGATCHYWQIKNAKIPIEKQNEFFSGAREIPERPDDVTGGEGDGDVYKKEAIVLYAELNNGFHLVEEVGAIEEIMLNRNMSGFISHFIADELMTMHPKECTCSRKDGSVLVTGPLYIIHPVISKDEIDACMDLNVAEFCKALAYLTSHTIYAKNNTGAIGFLLGKED